MKMDHVTNPGAPINPTAPSSCASTSILHDISTPSQGMAGDVSTEQAFEEAALALNSALHGYNLNDTRAALARASCAWRRRCMPVFYATWYRAFLWLVVLTHLMVQFFAPTYHQNSSTAVITFEQQLAIQWACVCVYFVEYGLAYFLQRDMGKRNHLVVQGALTALIFVDVLLRTAQVVPRGLAISQPLWPLLVILRSRRLRHVCLTICRAFPKIYEVWLMLALALLVCAAVLTLIFDDDNHYSPGQDSTSGQDEYSFAAASTDPDAMSSFSNFLNALRSLFVLLTTENFPSILAPLSSIEDVYSRIFAYFVTFNFIIWVVWVLYTACLLAVVYNAYLEQMKSDKDLKIKQVERGMDLAFQKLMLYERSGAAGGAAPSECNVVSARACGLLLKNVLRSNPKFRERWGWSRSDAHGGVGRLSPAQAKEMRFMLQDHQAMIILLAKREASEAQERHDLDEQLYRDEEFIMERLAALHQCNGDDEQRRMAGQFLDIKADGERSIGEMLSLDKEDFWHLRHVILDKRLLFDMTDADHNVARHPVFLDIVESTWFRYLVNVAILVNVFVLMGRVSATQHRVADAFLVLFVLELAMRIYAHGFYHFIAAPYQKDDGGNAADSMHDEKNAGGASGGSDNHGGNVWLPNMHAAGWNRFDLWVVVVSCIFRFLATDTRAVVLVRIVRAQRVFRLVACSRGLNTLLNAIIACSRLVVLMLGLVFCIIYCFATIGSWAFGDQGTVNLMQNASAGAPYVLTFDSFPSSFLAMFSVTVGNNWNDIMNGTTMATASNPPVLFFVVFFLMSNAISLSVLTSMVFDTFIKMRESEQRQTTPQAKARRARLNRMRRGLSVMRDGRLARCCGLSCWFGPASTSGSAAPHGSNGGTGGSHVATGGDGAVRGSAAHTQRESRGSLVPSNEGGVSTGGDARINSSGNGSVDPRQIGRLSATDLGPDALPAVAKLTRRSNSEAAADLASAKSSPGSHQNRTRRRGSQQIIDRPGGMQRAMWDQTNAVHRACGRH